MALKVKVSNHRHTGRLLPHEHTSYALLSFILLLLGVFLMTYTKAVSADPPPVSGNITISGAVMGPPPSQPAVIVNPQDGQHFTANPVTVSGTCPHGTTVKIFKNNVLAGSVICQSDDAFNLLIDLFFGQNDLVAHDYSVTDLVGPDSGVVTVYLDQPVSVAPPINVASPALLSQLYIKSDTAIYRGAFPGQVISWPAEIVGGTPPYAVSVTWGDGQSSLISRAVAGVFKAEHTYKLGGNYRVIFKVTDAAGNAAYLQLVAVVNSSVDTPTATTKPTFPERSSLILTWPLYSLAVFMVGSFGLGGRYAMWRMAKLHYIKKQA